MLRKQLYHHIDLVAKDPDRSLVAGEAFTRNRKIGLRHAIRLIASLQSRSIRQQTDTYFKQQHIKVTPSAVCQARSKFNHQIIKNAALSYTKEIVSDSDLYNGKYRFIGVDGSTFSILPNEDEPENNIHDDIYQIHFNAAYDLSNKYYLDYQIQPGTLKNENAAALLFVQNYDYPGTPVWIYDRLYFSYDLATQIEASGQKFVFRMKEWSIVNLLGPDQYVDKPSDYTGSRILVNTTKKSILKQSDVYKYVPKGKVSLMNTGKPELYFPYRLLIVEIESQDEKTGKKTKTMEYLLTNLDEDEFSTKEIAELYHLRWNIETSFRDLKCVLGAEQVHSRKMNLIEQEIDAAVMIYNFISAVSKCTQVVFHGRKYNYQLNRKALSDKVFQYLLGLAAQKEVIETIHENQEAIRKDRHYKRISIGNVVTSQWR